MLRPYLRRLRPALALLLLAPLFAACKDATATPKPPVDPTSELGTGIHPIIVADEPGPTTSYVSLQLRPIRLDATVAAYAGELTYDAQKLELTGAQFPTGVTGAWHLVSPGVVRFAGVTVDGTDADGTALDLRYVRRGAIDASTFSVKVGELVGIGTLDDLMPLFVDRNNPVFIDNNQN